MKSCPRCLNLSPDTAPACQQCGTVLDESVIARAGGKTNFRSPTMMEPPSTLRPSPPPESYRPSPPPPPPSLAPAAPATAPRAGRRGETVYVPPPQFGAAAGAAPAAAPRAAERRIIGILVTYSWKPEGQIFPLREGRNLIGRGDHCDIQVPEDPVLSNENSHITFRKTFVVGDMLSMSGTYLDGEPVEEQFRPLSNYAKIVTGSTQWTFVMLTPPQAVPGTPS